MLLALIEGNEWLILLLLTVLLGFKYGYENNFDNPGPWGLPIVGYLPFLNPGLLYRQLHDLAQKHGPIYQIRLGQRKAIVLTDPHLIEKAFNTIELAGRPEAGVTALLAEGGESQLAFCSPDPRWTLRRRMVNRAMGGFDTYGRTSLQTAVQESLQLIFKRIREGQGNPIDPQSLLPGPVMALMSGLSFGRPVDPGDPFLRRVDTFFQDLSKHQGKVELLTFFPILKWVFHSDIRDSLNLVRDFVHFLRLHIDPPARSEEEAYTFRTALKHVSNLKSTQEEKLSTNFPDENPSMLSVDLFDGGTIPLTENLSWLLLLVAVNPSVQDKVHMILDVMIPHNRSVSLDDEISLPYLRACVLETLRFASNLPFALPHTAIKTVPNFHGFRISKGTLIMANLWSVHRDPLLFPEPEKFRPERFLTKNGQIDLVLASKVKAFSVGLRSCPGETLAKRALFLIFASILRDYRLELSKTNKYNPLFPTAAFSLAPGPHKLKFWPRHNNNLSPLAQHRIYTFSTLVPA